MSAFPSQGPKPQGGYPIRVPGVSLSPRLLASGGSAAIQAADGVDSTPVVTEVYLAEILIPYPVTIQGLAVFAGSVWSDNFKLALFDSTGAIVCATASTAGSATADTYQRAAIASEFQTVPGTATAGTQAYLAPGTYYVALTLDGTTSRYNTFGKGNFGAGKVTGTVYATAFATTTLTITPPTTFTTALGPFVSPY